MCGLQCVERREDGDDGRLVVGGRSSVDPPVGIDWTRVRQRDDRRSLVEPPRADDRLERRRGPLRRIDRLAIVVGVQHVGVCGMWRDQLAVDDGGRVRDRQQARVETPRGHRFHDGVGVLPDVPGVFREVGQPEEVQIVGHDLALVRLPPGSGDLSGVLSLDGTGKSHTHCNRSGERPSHPRSLSIRSDAAHNAVTQVATRSATRSRMSASVWPDDFGTAKL